jgi:hypothetical protein
LADRVERQSGFLERENAQHLTEWGNVLKTIVLCYECHCPNAIDSQLTFDSGFAQNQLRTRGRRVFAVNEPLTRVLQEDTNFTVHTYFENQRRRLFTKFAAKHLTVFDGRGDRSTEDGTPMALPQVRSTREVWMEDWSYDTNGNGGGDPQGWQYAFNWPTALLSMGDWEPAASATTFVRRRKMLRTLIVLDERLRATVAE